MEVKSVKTELTDDEKKDLILKSYNNMMEQNTGKIIYNYTFSNYIQDLTMGNGVNLKVLFKKLHTELDEKIKKYELIEAKNKELEATNKELAATNKVLEATNKVLETKIIAQSTAQTLVNPILEQATTTVNKTQSQLLDENKKLNNKLIELNNKLVEQGDKLNEIETIKTDNTELKEMFEHISNSGIICLQRNCDIGKSLNFKTKWDEFSKSYKKYKMRKGGKSKKRRNNKTRR